MPAQVKLSTILEGLESQGDETHAYLDRQTGELLLLMDDEINAAEDDGDPADLPEWQRENVERAKELAADDAGRFVPLPDRFDVNEWDMMRDFATSREDDPFAERLLRAIHGRGAFRYFKDCIHEAGVADEWYKFRDARLRRIALNWCEAHDIHPDVNA